MMKKIVAFLLAILNFCVIAYANGIPEFIDEEIVASIFENEATNSIGSYHIRQVRMKDAAGEASAKLMPKWYD